MQSDETVKIAALPKGFVWGAVKAGIKASGNLDLAAAVAAKGRECGGDVYEEPGGGGAGDGGAEASDGYRRARGGGAGECGECELRDRAAGDRCLCADVRGGGGELWLHLR